ncbi:hypothetical protein DV737_g4029, partial [Chaetothyriales sp. CBS 132003]
MEATKQFWILGGLAATFAIASIVFNLIFALGISHIETLTALQITCYIALGLALTALLVLGYFSTIYVQKLRKAPWDLTSSLWGLFAYGASVSSLAIILTGVNLVWVTATPREFTLPYVRQESPEAIPVLEAESMAAAATSASEPSTPKSMVRMRNSVMVSGHGRAVPSVDKSDQSSVVASSGPGSPGPSIVESEYEETLPASIPSFVLSAGQRSSLIGYGRRKSVKREKSRIATLLGTGECDESCSSDLPSLLDAPASLYSSITSAPFNFDFYSAQPPQLDIIEQLTVERLSQLSTQVKQPARASPPCSVAGSDLRESSASCEIAAAASGPLSDSDLPSNYSYTIQSAIDDYWLNLFGLYACFTDFQLGTDFFNVTTAIGLIGSVVSP